MLAWICTGDSGDLDVFVSVYALRYLTEVQFLRDELGIGKERERSEWQQGINLIQERHHISMFFLPQLPLSLKQQPLHPAHLHTNTPKRHV